MAELRQAGLKLGSPSTPSDIARSAIGWRGPSRWMRCGRQCFARARRKARDKASACALPPREIDPAGSVTGFGANLSAFLCRDLPIPESINPSGHGSGRPFDRRRGGKRRPADPLIARLYGGRKAHLYMESRSGTGRKINSSVRSIPARAALPPRPAARRGHGRQPG